MKMAAALGAIRGAASSAMRWSRRARGWEVDTIEGFSSQVRHAAAMIEKHPNLVAVWRAGRLARIHTVNAQMQELLQVLCNTSVQVDCFTDDLGAIGEVYLGSWAAAFRIELDPRRRSLGRMP